MPKDLNLTYWKYQRCHGTGKIIQGSRAERCFVCDGTGNAMVDGAAEAHKRRLRQIDNLKSEGRALLD